MLANPVWLVLVGVLAGLLPGLFGFGGGWLVLPILTFGLGVPWPYASGMALCAILAASSGGAVARGWSQGRMPSQGTVCVLMLVAAGIGSLLGKVCLRDWLAGFPSAPLVLDVILAAVLLCVAYRYFAAAATRRGGGPEVEPTPALLAKVAGVTVLPGVLSGLTGIGGGVLYVPILLFMLGWKPDNARDVSRLAVLASALVGAGLYALGGGVPSGAAAYMFLPAGLVGAATSAISFDRQNWRQAFSILAGSLAAVALALTVMHAVEGGAATRAPGSGGAGAAALAVGVPLACGVACGLAMLLVKRLVRQPMRPSDPA